MVISVRGSPPRLAVPKFLITPVLRPSRPGSGREQDKELDPFCKHCFLLNRLALGWELKSAERYANIVGGYLLAKTRERECKRRHLHANR